MANHTVYKTGDLIIAKYGAGTQVVCVIRRLHTGGYKITRFVPSNDMKGGAWRPTNTTLPPSFVLGPLLDSDPRARAAKEG